MRAFFVRVMAEFEPKAGDRFVGMFFAESELDLGMALDERLDPGICEFSEIDISGEGVFISLNKTKEGESLGYSLGSCTEGLADLFDSALDDSLMWHSLSSWADEYHEALERVLAAVKSAKDLSFDINELSALIDVMTGEERDKFAKWQATTIFTEEDSGIKNWSGLDALLKRISH